MIRVAAFMLMSVPVVWVSRRSLRIVRSHGFSRFIAFEAILALLLLNAPHWFSGPFGARQVASWLLLGASLVFVAWAFVLLRRLGGFRPGDDVSPSFDWERTAHLVTSGIYRHVRHPMYSSLLFLAWGALLKNVTPAALALGLAATLALVSTARAEEAENLDRFGPEYRDYMARTRRFVPLLF